MAPIDRNSQIPVLLRRPAEDVAPSEPNKAPEPGPTVAVAPKKGRVPTKAERAEAKRQMAALDSAKKKAIANEVASLHSYASGLWELRKQQQHSPLSFEQDTAIRKRLNDFTAAMKGLGGSADVPEVHLLKAVLIPDTTAERKAGEAIKNLAKAASLDQLSESSRMVLGVAIARMKKYPALQNDPDVMKALSLLEAHSPISPGDARVELREQMARKLAASRGPGDPDMTGAELEAQRAEIADFLVKVEKFAPHLLKTEAGEALRERS